jgi:hypothetical protein
VDLLLGVCGLVLGVAHEWRRGTMSAESETGQVGNGLMAAS